MKSRRRALTRLADEIVKGGRVCGAPKKNGSPCRNEAGKWTDHPGTGLCWRHEDPDRAKAVDQQRYARTIRNSSIKNQMVKLSATDRDVFNLVPEIQLMRAIVVDYVDNYKELNDALLAWFKAGNRKPNRVIDITDVSNLLESISRMVERVHRIQATRSISMEVFRRAMEQMGVIVAKHVSSSAALEAIEREWNQISLDSKSPVALLPESTSTVTSTPITPEKEKTHGKVSTGRVRPVRNKKD